MVSAAFDVRHGCAMARAALPFALLACALATWAPDARAAPVPWYIESEFQPPRTYVGAEVALRLRLLRAPGVPYGVLRPPRLGEDAEVIPIGRVRAYVETRKGVAYEVREQNYVVVPRREGKLVLPGPEVVGPLRQAGASTRPPSGVPRTLEVRAPRAVPGEPWLPARRIAIEESWSQDPGALSAGQPVVRTLVVRAEGLSGNRLPALRMAEHPRLSAHHEASRFSSQYLDAGMAGQRTQRVVLIAQEEGEIELPALSVDWWDTVADEPRTTTLPARRLRVGEIAPPPLAPLPPTPAEISPLEAMRWFALVLFVLSGTSLWLYARRQPEREAKKRLRAACRRGHAQQAHKALIEWWNSETAGEAAPLLARVGDAWDSRARAALAALDAALYGGKAWDGRQFWRAVKPWLRKRAAPARRAPHDAGARAAIPPHARPAADALPPLFRLQAR
jgi:hypothetical protein